MIQVVSKRDTIHSVFERLGEDTPMHSLENCEEEIRDLCHVWHAQPEQWFQSANRLFFSDFARWLIAEGYGEYIDFLTRNDAIVSAKGWFSDELQLEG